jgi:hypothetical protein
VVMVSQFLEFFVDMVVLVLEFMHVVDFLFEVFTLFSVVVDSLGIFVIVGFSVMERSFNMRVLFSDDVELLGLVFVLFLKFVVMVSHLLEFFVDVVVLVLEFVHVVDFLFEVFTLFSVVVDSLGIFVIVGFSVMERSFNVRVLFSDDVELLGTVFVLFLEFVVMVSHLIEFLMEVVVLALEFA